MYNETPSATRDSSTVLGERVNNLHYLASEIEKHCIDIANSVIKFGYILPPEPCIEKKQPISPTKDPEGLIGDLDRLNRRLSEIRTSLSASNEVLAKII